MDEFDFPRGEILRLAEGEPYVIFTAPWTAGSLSPSAFVLPAAEDWKVGERAILIQTGAARRATVLGPAPPPASGARYRVRDFRKASPSAPPALKPAGVANMARAEAAALLSGHPSSSSFGDKCLQLALIAHGAPAGIAKYRTLRGSPPLASPLELDKLKGKHSLAKLGEELCNFLLEDDTKS